MKSEYFPEKIVSMLVFKDLIYIATEFSLWVGTDHENLKRVEIDIPENESEFINKKSEEK